MDSTTHPLTRYRKRSRLTLEAYAARVGTSKSWLSRIEAYSDMPSTALINRIIQESAGKLSANDFFAPARVEASR
jgi:transcriptional regulator with XRE-family HTH domain